jgi:hypothetical protein
VLHAGTLTSMEHVGSNARTTLWWQRAAAYFGVAVATSGVVGVAATSLSDTWATMNPVNASLLGLLGFGPMSFVLALAPVSRVVLYGISALLAVVVAGMWVAYATNDSSTSALIFVWAWIAGVPLAAVAVVQLRRGVPRQSQRPGHSSR